MKLNMRQMIASTIPAVANTTKITVREISTAPITSTGLPSYGVPPIIIITSTLIYFYNKIVLLLHSCPLNDKLSTAGTLISTVPILSLPTDKPELIVDIVSSSVEQIFKQSACMWGLFLLSGIIL